MDDTAALVRPEHAPIHAPDPRAVARANATADAVTELIGNSRADAVAVGGPLHSDTLDGSDQRSVVLDTVALA